MSMENPFAPRAEPRPRKKPSVFVTHRPAPTKSELATEARWRKQEREPADIERMTAPTELSTYLAEHGHEDACLHAYSCDPWKYEPVLFDDLVKERMGANDPQSIAELRGLIRAGSWMTYPRPDKRDLKDAMDALRQTERQRWSWKIKQADPDTSRELSETMKDTLKQIDAIQQAIDEQRIGDDAEEAARHVEDIHASLWLTLKAEMRVHGLTDEDMDSRPATKALHEEIERLRPIRDLLYFRRLYPKLASKSLVNNRIET